MTVGTVFTLHHHLVDMVVPLDSPQPALKAPSLNEIPDHEEDLSLPGIALVRVSRCFATRLPHTFYRARPVLSSFLELYLVQQRSILYTTLPSIFQVLSPYVLPGWH